MNIQHIRSGDYFIPDLKLADENHPIGKWGHTHRVEGITGALKATDPIAWAQHMSNICARAEYLVREELIYT